MNILAIETSCDETSVAIVRNGRHILANVVASQIALHRRYGGVVPELASRQHVVTIIPTLEEALKTAGLTWAQIDAVAVTKGPGLSPALLVGVNAAKSLAFARQKPLVAVNHVEGHVYSNWLIPEAEAVEGRAAAEPILPAVCLIVSGGHTELVLMSGHGQYKLLGKTIDDAAGEAFDKAARILGLGYPGGPAIQKAADGGDPTRFSFPRAWLKGTLDFSFSGLKTALLRKVEEYGVTANKPMPWQRTEAEQPTNEGRTGTQAQARVESTVGVTTRLAEISTRGGDGVVSSFTSEPLSEDNIKLPPPVRVRVTPPGYSSPEQTHRAIPKEVDKELPVADLAASFQAAAVDALVEKTVAAAAETGAREVLVAGGVAANKGLRQALSDRLSVPFRYPPLSLCTDNAAMIAAAAYYRYADSMQHDLSLDIEPNARFM